MDATRYRIEYLKETTKEGSVCLFIRSPGPNLSDVALDAWKAAHRATLLGAGGFQIRDMETGAIVALETFDGLSGARPLG